MKNNNPPFAIGQKVARTGSSNDTYCKGKSYTVKAIGWCCGNWYITTEEKPSTTNLFDCNICQKFIKGMSYHYGGLAKNFAPYNPPSVEIDEEIINQAKENMVEERVKELEVVNN